MTMSNVTVKKELPQSSKDEPEIVEPLADEGFKKNLKLITLNLKEFSEQHSKLILICPIMIDILQKVDQTLLSESEAYFIYSALSSYEKVSRCNPSLNIFTKIDELNVSSVMIDQLSEVIKIIYHQFQNHDSEFVNLFIFCALIAEITPDLEKIFSKKVIQEQLESLKLPNAPEFLRRSKELGSIKSHEISQLVIIPFQHCARFGLFANNWTGYTDNIEQLSVMTNSIAKKYHTFLDKLNELLPKNDVSKQPISFKKLALKLTQIFNDDSIDPDTDRITRSSICSVQIRRIKNTFCDSGTVNQSEETVHPQCLNESDNKKITILNDSTPKTSPLSYSSSSHSSEDDIKTSEYSSKDTQKSSPRTDLSKEYPQSLSLDNTDDFSRGLSSDKLNSEINLDIADLNKKINDLKKRLKNRYNALEEAQLNILMYLEPYIKNFSNEGRPFINQVANTCIHYTPDKAIETQRALQYYCQRMSNRRKTDRCYLRGLGMGLMVFSCGIAIALIAGALIAPGGISLLATATLAIGAIAGMSISTVSAATTISSVAFLSATLGSFLFFSKNKPETLTKKINSLDSEIENSKISTKSESSTN